MNSNEWNPKDVAKLVAFHKAAREAQEAAIDAWLTDGFEPPTMTAEEADIENKAAAVTEFVAACKAIVEAIDDMEALEIIGNEFADLRAIASQAAYVFDPDDDDRSLEDLS